MPDTTITTTTTTESKPGAFFLTVIGLAMITGSFAFPIGADVPYSPLTPAPLIMANRSLMHYAELLNITGVGAFISGCVLAIGGWTTRVSLTPAAGAETAEGSTPTDLASAKNTVPWGKIIVAVAMIAAILLIRAYYDSRQSLVDSRRKAVADANAAAMAAHSAAEGAAAAKEMADAEAAREAFQRRARAKLNNPPEIVSPGHPVPEIILPDHHTSPAIR